MQSKEEKLISLFTQARRFCEQAAKFTRQACKLRFKARDLENPGNAKTDANAAIELREKARKATTDSRQQLGQLFNSKEEIKTQLLAFGEPAQPFREALEKLSFNSHGFPNYSDSVDEDGILNGCQQFQQLALVTVQTLAPEIEVTKNGDVLPHHKKKSKRSRGTRQSKHPQTYSGADDARYHRIGLKEIETLTNRELWKRYRKSEQAKRLGYDFSAFRHSLNRIRTHHHLPTSQDIKSDQGFGHKK